MLRHDPDVIMVGEIRDNETADTAINAALTGHLVFSTLHTNDACQTVDRIVDVFPPHQQSQVRQQVAASLLAVVSQRLLPRADTDGRVAAFEMMIATPAIRNLIREGKITAAMGTSLMNDQGYARDVVWLLADAAKTLFGSKDVADMEAEELIGLDDEDIEEIIQQRV